MVPPLRHRQHHIYGGHLYGLLVVEGGMYCVLCQRSLPRLSLVYRDRPLLLRNGIHPRVQAMVTRVVRIILSVLS